MAEQSSRMSEVDTHIINSSSDATERTRAFDIKVKDEIDEHINSILGSDYFGKTDGFLKFKTPIKQETNVFKIPTPAESMTPGIGFRSTYLEQHYEKRNQIQENLAGTSKGTASYVSLQEVVNETISGAIIKEHRSVERWKEISKESTSKAYGDEEVKIEADEVIPDSQNMDGTNTNNRKENGMTDNSYVNTDIKSGNSLSTELHENGNLKDVTEVIDLSVNKVASSTCSVDQGQMKKKRLRKLPAPKKVRKKPKFEQNVNDNAEENSPIDLKIEALSTGQSSGKKPLLASKPKKPSAASQRFASSQDDLAQEKALEALSAGLTAGLTSMYMSLPIKFDDNDSDKPHKCSYCNKGFKKPANLRRHILTHTGERNFSCDACGKSFSTSQALRLHLRVHTGDKPYQCEVCLKKFTYNTNYKIHLRSHSNERPFPCLVCGRAYTMSTTLKRHMLIHAEDRPYKCEKCPKQFAKSLQLKSHMVSHSGMEPYACGICDKQFSQTYPLGKHLLKHAEELYVDEIHPEAYMDGSVSEAGKIDMPNTDGEIKESTKQTSNTITSNYKTDSDKDVTGEESIKETQDDISSPQKTPLRQSRCKVCKEVFVSLKQHMRVHMDKQPYYCTLCKREFLELTNLKQHLSTHTGDKPFVCDECGREFAQASNLKAHMRVHTGERPYNCHICGKTFAHSSSMKNHIRFHTGEVCYYCSHCGKGFTDKSSQKKHERTHTGDKPYLCVTCGRGFAASSSLKTHMFTHGGHRPYQCDQGDCEKQFARPSQLQKHLLKRHDIDRTVESLFDNNQGIDHSRDDLGKLMLKNKQGIITKSDQGESSEINHMNDFEIDKVMGNLNPLIDHALKEVDRKSSQPQLIENDSLQENHEVSDGLDEKGDA